MKPFSTYPEDRTKLLELAAKAADSDDAAAIELADLVKAILTDEQAVIDAEILTDPPTLPVGTKLFAVPVKDPSTN